MSASDGPGGTGPAAPPPAERLESIDAYRGLVMLLMLAEVLHFCRVSRALPGNRLWELLCRQQTHALWTGCSLHDLIQPSFSFLVGVALTFSLARRSARGEGHAHGLAHAALRAFLLVGLGIFLRSVDRPRTNFTFEDTLTQIGLGYVPLYLLARRGARTQWAGFALLLAVSWAAFALHPLPGSDLEPAPGPDRMSGLAAHWSRNGNLGADFDTWLLNRFPRERPFIANEGGYATLNFIPTLATMILGLRAGSLLRERRAVPAAVVRLAASGLVALAAGLALDRLGICPIVKRLWTPSFTLYSGGWCLLMLAAFHGLIEGRGFRRWALPLVVLGMNSIAAYCLHALSVSFISDSLRTHLGEGAFAVLGTPYVPLVRGFAVLLVVWLILYGMYRKRIFLRL